MSALEPPIEPVRKQVRVACSVEEAFRLFVEDIGSWWPVEVHSRAAHDQFGGGVTVTRVVFERRVGGRLYEVTSEGAEGSWAEVVVYEPPARLVLAWKPERSSGASDRGRGALRAGREQHGRAARASGMGGAR